MLNAEKYLDMFQKGEDFTPPARGVFTNNQPDTSAIQLLEKKIKLSTPEVQEKIVALLIDIGLQTNILKSSGAEVLTHPEIIKILSNTVIHGSSLARESSIDALRKLVMPADLAQYGEQYSKVLLTNPSEDLFLLIAKAKPMQAKEIVDKLVSTSWQDSEEALIAQAALGETQVEDEFLRQTDIAEAEKDAKALAYSLGSLSLIGTKRSLQAVAMRLRTPIILVIPNVYDKALRLTVLEALLYNYPNQPQLYPNNIIDESDYSAAEKFCEKTLAVTYSEEPPPFFTIGGYPLRM